MRPVLNSDVTAAARALLTLPEAVRAGAFRSMLDKAQAADLYRKRIGRAHPFWGNGSLMAVARMAPLPPEPFLSDPGYLDCLATVVEGLIARAAGDGSRPRTIARFQGLSG